MLSEQEIRDQGVRSRIKIEEEVSVSKVKKKPVTKRIRELLCEDITLTSEQIVYLLHKEELTCSVSTIKICMNDVKFIFQLLEDSGRLK